MSIQLSDRAHSLTLGSLPTPQINKSISEKLVFHTGLGMLKQFFPFFPSVDNSNTLYQICKVLST